MKKNKLLVLIIWITVSVVEDKEIKLRVLTFIYIILLYATKHLT